MEHFTAQWHLNAFSNMLQSVCVCARVCRQLENDTDTQTADGETEECTLSILATSSLYLSLSSLAVVLPTVCFSSLLSFHFSSPFHQIAVSLTQIVIETLWTSKSRRAGGVEYRYLERKRLSSGGNCLPGQPLWVCRMNFSRHKMFRAAEYSKRLQRLLWLMKKL